MKPEIFPSTSPAHPSLKPSSKKWQFFGILAVITALGAFLRFYQLGAHSIGNTYYAAAVKSMLTSWKNFFFVAFEPGGSVTVDKPPLGLWIQAGSAYLFGVNGFALALPQTLAGTLSIPLLYHLVRKHFSRLAGLTAALVLALTPIAIAAERNNTMDGVLVFVLLLSAWAFLLAAETGKLRTLLLGGFLLGLGFNIKMLQAVMPLPALYGVYLLGSKHSWGKKLLHLVLTSLVFLVVAFAWVIAVDLTPADQRPYIGSSTDNTVLELILGHNGLKRLGLSSTGQAGNEDRVRADGGGDGPSGVFPQNQNLQAFPRPQGQPPRLSPDQDIQPLTQDRPPPGIEQKTRPQGQGRRPLASGPNQPPLGQDGPPQEPGQGFQGAPGAGGRSSETGSAGLMRLFQEPLVTEASWLLPLALLGIPLSLTAAGWRWPLNKTWLGVIFWAGWLLPGLVYFSATTGLFHRYYLIMIGPPLAALVGAALVSVEIFWKRRKRWGWTLLLVLSGFTLGFELLILSSYPAYFPLTAALSLLSWIGSMVWLALRSAQGWQRTLGYILVLAALLAAPFTWSVLTTLNTNPNTALPSAGPASSDSTRATFMTPNEEYLTAYGKAVLEYTQDLTNPEEYLLATNTAKGAAPFILETGRAVLTFGGFTGNDDVVDLERFQELVAEGELRFVLGLPREKPEISGYILSSCELVRLQENNGGNAGQVEVLYDCGN